MGSLKSRAHAAGNQASETTSKEAAHPWKRAWLLAPPYGAAVAILALACQQRPSVESSTVETQHLPLEPAVAKPVADEFCRSVQEQAKATNTQLPRQLDRGTRAESMSARGCEVELAYQLVDTQATEVGKTQLLAVIGQVTDSLCQDPPTRAVLEHGGSFRSVYRDQDRELIGDFTVALGDCSL